MGLVEAEVDVRVPVRVWPPARGWALLWRWLGLALCVFGAEWGCFGGIARRGGCPSSEMSKQLLFRVYFQLSKVETQRGQINATWLWFYGQCEGCKRPRERLILFRIFVLKSVSLCLGIYRLLGCKGLILGNFSSDNSGDKLFFTWGRTSSLFFTLFFMWGRTSSLWRWWSTGTGCPGRLWSLLLWRIFKPHLDKVLYSLL